MLWDELEPGNDDSIFFDGEKLVIIDQRCLPYEEKRVSLLNPDEVACAIRALAVRGAMAIGVAAAYGVVLGALREKAEGVEAVLNGARKAIGVIGSSRPTARNLFWALESMSAVLEEGHRDPDSLIGALRERAGKIARHTIAVNRKLISFGVYLIPDGASAITHCHSGELAALRYGTALSILIEAHRRGKRVHVFVDETRPLMQGSRITAWELARAGVPHTLICDNAAGWLMKRGKVDLAITGADRIAANGDTANKIGTYSLAVLAKHHRIPFYIAAPGSTVDFSCASGEEMVIEERDPDEVRTFGGKAVAPDDVPVHNPAFDVTPSDLIEAIITEKGILTPPYQESLRKAFAV